MTKAAVTPFEYRGISMARLLFCKKQKKPDFIGLFCGVPDRN